MPLTTAPLCANASSRSHKLTSTQRGLLLDALAWYSRQVPPALANDLQQLISAASTATYLVPQG